MVHALSTEGIAADQAAAEQNTRIADVIRREQSRLRRFVLRHVPDADDAEDILQDVFAELVDAYRLMQPVEQAGAWLHTVARNRIVDFFRRKKPERFERVADGAEGEMLSIEDLLPSPNAGPDAAYARQVLLDELAAAVEELPAAQREVFVAHEIEGRSFADLAKETGVGVNTLLSRKHYAVLHLRRRLQAIYDEFIQD